MEITYIYDDRGDSYTINKTKNHNLKTLTIAHVGDRVYHTQYNEYGIIDKVDINDYDQTYRIEWENCDEMPTWPATKNVIVIDYWGEAWNSLTYMTKTMRCISES